MVPMNIQAYCLKCGKMVTALPVLPEDEFWPALDKDADIEVMHVSRHGDHRWRLTELQKDNLRRKRAAQGRI